MKATAQSTGPDRSLIRKVLVATDFSPVSNLAVEKAVALANQCHASLTILHVININTRGELGTAAEAMHHLWNDGSSKMGELAWSLQGQANTVTVLEEGLPSEVIAAKSKDFDLLLLGDPGQRKGWRFCSKQTLQGIRENAACPVMLVRADEPN